MIHTGLFFARALVLLILLSGLGFGCMPSAQASEHGACSHEMNNRAESLLVGARGNWSSLLKHQRTFVSCDDGELGEGYSEAVVNLFAHRWDQFGTFSVLARKNPAFKFWAVRHIDATTSDEDLNRIVLNTSACINDAAVASLCKDIRRAAENALKESAHMRR